jgi:hypothetical protein
MFFELDAADLKELLPLLGEKNWSKEYYHPINPL